eukprot:TRINITY_DN3606_c0_g1_i1.p1 TRINITY_DN3606_c0_g1~~TRINITY_DN3606_c0_g1_i1.p1  ORF type:complete len:620 (+),score=31.42 TRINITY_DN3606_c0_g1_i1:148-1860(+)
MENKMTSCSCLSSTHPHTHQEATTPSSSQSFDIFVIGGGSGGLALAREAAELGAKVGLADYVKPTPKGTKWDLGGTCVNVGCIPKKLMHYASLCGDAIREQKGTGWALPEKVQHNWARMQANVARHIKSLNCGYKAQLEERKVNYFNKLASFIDKNTILVLLFLIQPQHDQLRDPEKHEEETVVKAKHIVIATGGRPNYEGIIGAKEYAITSDDLFWMQKPPGKTLVVGGAYVALECAGFLSHLGFPTTLMVRSVILRNYDQEMAARVGSHLEHHGVKMYMECIPTLLTKSESGRISVKYTELKTNTPKEEEFDTVLLAIGRRATTEGMGLDKIGVKIADNGKIWVNDKEQTTVDNVFALGDVAYGRPEFSPVAIKTGKLIARRLMEKSDELMDYVNIPCTVYTPLEYGFCGHSEESADKIYGKDGIIVHRTKFKPLEWSFLESRKNEECYMKVIVEKKSDKVIGFHYFGQNAGEITQGYAVGIKCGITKAQWDKTNGVHPACAEELLVTIPVKSPLLNEAQTYIYLTRYSQQPIFSPQQVNAQHEQSVLPNSFIEQHIGFSTQCVFQSF